MTLSLFPLYKDNCSIVFLNYPVQLPTDDGSANSISTSETPAIKINDSPGAIGHKSHYYDPSSFNPHEYMSPVDAKKYDAYDKECTRLSKKIHDVSERFKGASHEDELERLNDKLSDLESKQSEIFDKMEQLILKGSDSGSGSGDGDENMRR